MEGRLHRASTESLRSHSRDLAAQQEAREQQLLANGKAEKLALTAVMRKLIILANRLLKNPHFTLTA